MESILRLRPAAWVDGVRCVVAALTLALLAACAAPPVRTAPQELFADDVFAPPSEPVGAGDLFALTDAMRSFLRREVSLAAQREGPAHALVNALNDRARLRLDYDATVTRTASQAFEARAGNCLSLLVLTAAMARELGLVVQFQSAYVDDTWSRSGDLHIASGHVNIVLNPRLSDRRYLADRQRLLVDFLPADALRGLRTRIIDESTVNAMFLTNRATEALLRGAIDDAYWWARAAIVASPSYFNAYNTLGVIYQRHGDAPRAERVFAQVLGHDPDNRHALFNQAQLLGRLGRAGESEPLRQRLAQIEPHAPFHWFDLGQAAMQRGDYALARELFAREVARADYNHEFHFWLGVAHWRLGEMEQARRHLELAMAHGTTSDERARYAGKLESLRQQAHP